MNDSVNAASTAGPGNPPGRIDITPQSPPAEFDFLKQQFGDRVLRYDRFREDLVIEVLPGVIPDALRALRDLFDPAYNYLSYITADHWIENTTPLHLKPPAFELVYGLQAIPFPGTRLRLVIIVPDAPGISVPSVTDIYPAADWHEREIFDLFGVKFDGHPNLTRILTPETYPEHPLRRDFPHGGPELMEFQDRLVAQWNVAEERDYTGKFGDPWITKILEQQKGRISLKRIWDTAGGSGELEPPGDIAHDEHKPEKSES